MLQASTPTPGKTIDAGVIDADAATLLTSMMKDVLFQLRRLYECLVAVLAHMWLHSGVGTEMTVQCFLRCEASHTLRRTRNHKFSSALKILSCIRQAYLLAFVRLLASVRSNVFRQRPERDESFRAMFTCERTLA